MAMSHLWLYHVFLAALLSQIYGYTIYNTGQFCAKLDQDGTQMQPATLRRKVQDCRSTKYISLYNSEYNIGIMN